MKRGSTKAKRKPLAVAVQQVVLVFIAHIRANVWCLFHFGHCILTCQTKARGYWPQTDSIEVGKGSILNGTWKTVKVFYQNPTVLRSPHFGGDKQGPVVGQQDLSETK